MRIGAQYLGAGTCDFVVWAPERKEVAVRIVSPEELVIPLSREERGYWHTTAVNIWPGARYLFRLDNELERPDPASHFQPHGVHGPSEVIDHTAFQWENANWPGLSLAELIIYELHIGAFTPEGTFEAALKRLDDLRDLGITAIEIMPVAQFPGERNWGYDGVYPFAVQNSYGGPEGLKKLVNACHKSGLAVILDVVYNHLGPEGNYLAGYGPYFTDKYRTPWGGAINFDEGMSDQIRNYFIENALYWLRDYHIDGLRLDAIDTIGNHSARPFLMELADSVREFAGGQNRQIHLIAESDLNDPRVIRPKQSGGLGLSAQWNDDFHHALHALLTDEPQGYYLDFGNIVQLAKAYREGFVFSGEYSAYRRRKHGASTRDDPAQQFVVFAQNHDQIGNRKQGERLSSLVSFEVSKLAAGSVLLAPNVPLLFMGEEYGEEAPFLYFVSHNDRDLIEAVRAGRKAEFADFCWQGDPPDPQSPETFERSKLHWDQRSQDSHGLLLEFHRCLIKLRRKIPALSHLSKKNLEVAEDERERFVLMHRWYGESQVFCALNFNYQPITFRPDLPMGQWKKLIDSSETNWLGPGSLLPEKISRGSELSMRPQSIALFERQGARGLS
jgi:maltooligosyltrehalose trehalohydrolase